MAGHVKVKELYAYFTIIYSIKMLVLKSRGNMSLSILCFVVCVAEQTKKKDSSGYCFKDHMLLHLVNLQLRMCVLWWIMDVNTFVSTCLMATSAAATQDTNSK